MKDVLLGPVIAGVRRHERTGKEFPGAWPAIISTDERQLLISLLKRKSGRPKSRKYPLSGILVCSECGRGMGGRTQPGGRRQYACPDQHMSIAGNATEDLVLDAVQERDQAYGRKRALRGPSRENHDTVLALGRLTEQRQTLEMAAELGAEVGDAISRLNAEETALRATVDPEAAPTVPKDDPERRDRRHRGELTEAEVLQSAEWVRSWVRSVTVQPAKHTKTPPSERLEIAWRD